ncbi:MAG: hypothetical protein DCF19_22490 [Pseudanabaena frigida]|uniref:DUF3592 domain-containing protein n=1 Tax=Pseudanabaena frigida TaxID=945775 RepID=A0A2W4XXT6_9CYAN|nr:MAG: hypothetical protein DCF19_22490 [Pseudanabaena frigida]
MFKSNKIKLFFFYLFGIGILIALGYLLLPILNNLSNSYQSQSWESVNGKVTNSYISTQEASSKYKYLFTPHVSYEYTVAKKVYSGDTIAFYSDKSTDAKYVQTIIAKYPTGSQIKVFYNSSSPNISCLETGFSQEAVFVVSFVFLAGGIIIILIVLKIRKFLNWV